MFKAAFALKLKCSAIDPFKPRYLSSTLVLLTVSGAHIHGFKPAWYWNPELRRLAVHPTCKAKGELAVLNSTRKLGSNLNSPFYWKGFGWLRFTSDEMSFEPDEIRLEALQPMSAERVLRKNVQHSVLVGDQEITSGQVTGVIRNLFVCFMFCNINR